MVVGYGRPCQGCGARDGKLLAFTGHGVPDRFFCADCARHRLVPGDAPGPHWTHDGRTYLAALQRWSRS